MSQLAREGDDEEALRLFGEALDHELDEPRRALELAITGLERAQSIEVRAQLAFFAGAFSALFMEDERAFAHWEWIREEESLSEPLRLAAALQHVFLRLNRGQALGEEDLALIFDETLIGRSKDPVLIHQIRAQYFVLNGAHESAFHAASMAIEIGGDDLDLDPLQAINIHASRGFAASGLGLFAALDEAIEVIEELLEIHPGVFLGQMVLRQLRFQRAIHRGDGDAAMKEIVEAEVIARETGNIWHGFRVSQIELLIRRGRTEEARALIDDEFDSAEVPARFQALTAHVFGVAESDPELVARAFALYAELRLDSFAIQASRERVELLITREDPDAEAAMDAHLEYLFDALHRAPTERDRLHIQSSLLRAVDLKLAHFLIEDAEGALLLITRAKSACIKRIVLRRAEHPGDAERDLGALEHRALYDELTRVHPLSARPVDEAQLSFEELQRSLPSNAAALEIYLGADEIYLFLLSSDGLESRKLKLDGELDDALFALLEPMRNRPSTEIAALTFEASLAYVYDRLISPWEETLNDRELLLVSHGALFSDLPLGALIDPGDRFLIERVAIAHITSFARLPEIEFLPAPPRSFRAIRGFDRDDKSALLHADSELAAARAIADRSGLIIKDSAPKKLIDHFDAELVHYAGHASPGNEHLMDIALPLSASRELRAAELFAHDLRHISLITLAACETGGSLLFRGDEVGGFVRALSAAGVKRSLLARLPIDDAWTAEFLERVYAHYFAGLTIERALAEAIRELLHEAREADERLSPALFGNFLVYL